MGCTMAKRQENKKRQIEIIEGASCDDHVMKIGSLVIQKEITRMFDVFVKLDRLPQAMMYSYFGYVPFIKHGELNSIRDYLNMTRPHLRYVFIHALTDMKRRDDTKFESWNPYPSSDRPQTFIQHRVVICGIAFQWMDSYIPWLDEV